MSTSPPAKVPKPKSERITSKIQFPYSDMGDAIAVAQGMMKGGGVGMSRDQLAAAMHLAPGGGGFATKVATARMFGVIDATSGQYELTGLGHEILDPRGQADAKARAFLYVELYKRAYDEFKGRLLPPRPHGLEAAFIKFGVSPKTVKFARLAFEKSARMAGFFPNAAEDRLVKPFGTTPGSATAEDSTEPIIVEAVGRASATSSARAISAPVTKALEYQLVDLLTAEGIGDAEADAIWTLVRFLSSRAKGAS